MGSHIKASAGNRTINLRINRPKFFDLWNNYPIATSAPQAYQLVGGDAYKLFLENPNGYANACALRLSRAMNYGGMPIKSTEKGYHVKGGDGKNYLLRVRDMINFVKTNFGEPDLILKPKMKENVSVQLKNKKGVIIFKVQGWEGATGHVTLWDGMLCGDHCYFVHPDQPNVQTTEVLFWRLI